MKKQCILCGRPTGLMSAAKTMDGELCSSCSKMIPSVFPAAQVHNFSITEIRQLLAYEAEIAKKGMSITASYGKLHIDESNGLFAISEKVDGEEPTDKTSIFSVRDLKDVAIYVVNPKVQKDNSVTADVEMSCVFFVKLSEIALKIKIKSGVKCSSKKIDRTHLEWDEPGDLSMFRNMFNQMIRNEERKLSKQLENCVTQEDIDKFKAKSAFFIGKSYIKGDIESKRESLLKAFRGDAEAISKINYYYALLMKEFE